jgi:hypothetical protein
MSTPSFNWARRGAIVLGILAILAGAGAWLYGRNREVAMTTPYQAVLLTNGSAYFGRLEGLGTPFPVLKEVKRGKEWHAPDRMILNSNMIVLVEPVNPSSRVAQLIAEAKNQ